MADIEGTNNNDNLNGNGGGQADTILGGRGNDTLQGQSGDDYLSGGRGNDVLIGGQGSDVMAGGLDADIFSFSAGHVGNGAIDWITDFSLSTGDTLRFLASASGGIQITNVDRAYVQNTSASGYDLENNVATGTDLVFDIVNTATGQTQKIVLLDAWSGAMASAWTQYLATLGYTDSLDNIGQVTLGGEPLPA